MSTYPTDRIILFDRCDNPIGDLSPAEPGFDCIRVLELNGEHSLTVTTHRVIDEGTRALTVDGMGIWSEWVCDEPDEMHAQGRRATGTYRFVWSLQYDLQSVYGAELRPGIPNPVTAAVALAAALDGTTRWSVGTVDVVATGSLSMYDNSAWDRLSDVVSVFGGEVDTEIDVGPTGVVSRRVSLRAHLGTTNVTRRFDWSRDITSIRRTPAPGPRFCRVIPRGKGEQVESSTGGVAYTRRINIKSVNGGVEYLRDEDAELAFRVPNGSGGYEYPRTIVIYESIEDPQELYNTALADLHNHTRPAVTYEADVQQFARAGMDVRGIALGDNMQIVDREFAEGVALRIQGRILRLSYNFVSKEMGVTLGKLAPTLADSLMKLESGIKEVASLTRALEAGGTADYLLNLIGRLNEEINATGGYSYIVPGIGLRTYDVAVSDPAVGSEATKVVEVRGGSIRIADSRTSAGDWDFDTVFVSGHIAAELVTAVSIVSGYIGSSNGDFFIDLDNHEYKMPGSTTFGGDTVADIADAAVAEQTQLDLFNKLTNNGQTQGIYLSNGLLYINASYISSGTLTVGSGSNIKFSASVSSSTVSIAGFTVSSSAFYNGKTSMTSNESGVYISTSGIAVGNNTASRQIKMSDGYIRGGRDGNSIDGYVGFASYLTSTGVYGTRVAGRGHVSILTDGYFGIGSYYSISSTAPFSRGMSGSVRVMTGSGYKTITFKQGLMVTDLSDDEPVVVIG